MGDTVRALNAEGIECFRKYLAELREGSTCLPPSEILTDPRLSSGVPGAVEIEKRIFENRLDAVRYLSGILRLLPRSQIDQNVNLWSWLSLYYFDQVCPRNTVGRRNPGRDCRHVLDLDFRLYHRHLLAGPYGVYMVHGERAPMLLSGPLYETSKHYVELTSRQALLVNKGVIEAASLLYFDASNAKPKWGAAVAAKKLGTMLRFIDVVQQLDLTYDLHSMTGEEVVALLPSEFDGWRPK